MDWINGTIDDFKAEYDDGRARGPRAIRWLLEKIYRLENAPPDPDAVYTFICPICEAESGWTIGQVSEGGSPICGECDADMILGDSAKQKGS